MAKDEATETSTHVAMNKDKFLAFLSKNLKAQDVLDRERGAMGEKVAAASEKENLHPAAFRDIKKLKRMLKKRGSAAVTEYLFHWDLYREWSELDKQEDMLPERKGRGSRKKKDTDEGAQGDNVTTLPRRAAAQAAE